jgi:hypothetical protein
MTKRTTFKAIPVRPVPCCHPTGSWPPQRHRASWRRVLLVQMEQGILKLLLFSSAFSAFSDER